MPTRPGQSKALLDDLLSGNDPVIVEAAIARLAIAGRPALRQVLARLGEADAAHLPRLLRVLERIGDPAGLAPVRPLLRHGSLDVALAAVDAIGALLDAKDGSVASAALDALTATLLDQDCPEVVRLRVYETLAGAPDRSTSYDADVLEPLRQQLRKDPSAALRRAVNGEDAAEPRASEPSGDARLEAAAGGQLPADAEQLRQLLAAHGNDVPLTLLHRVIERIRSHERTVSGDGVEAWRVARATAHLALADRGSRLAVYDLRETLDALGAQTPVGMLSALQQVGDASVLDVVADAYAASQDAWFRGQLVGIFRAVVGREQLTKRSAAAKKLATRVPEAFGALWG